MARKKVVITKDYEWKYGEPSIYNDEKLWYLIIKVNGSMIEPENEDKILKRLGLTYKETLKQLNRTAELIFTL